MAAAILECPISQQRCVVITCDGARKSTLQTSAGREQICLQCRATQSHLSFTSCKGTSANSYGFLPVQCTQFFELRLNVPCPFIIFLEDSCNILHVS
ncbi:hypothetical protein AVEN_16840-1 [Araneus ventricosus]|uniref:Uncharacterized protein n=1 Tax=Araneus ventricosus TaxID=182803 RepID=A0A4Y2BQK0_ARAVE|nr:hypothetical protein AVEN_16840-1 [Araneus ventricosus]